MTTLHIENTVHDYDAWKAAFDKFDHARRDRGVRAYRISRPVGDASKVVVDLDFHSTTRAEEFCEFLRGVWRTPQSQSTLVGHSPPVLLEVVEHQVLPVGDNAVLPGHRVSGEDISLGFNRLGDA